MMLDDVLQLLGDGALLAATPAVLGFTLRYGIRSDWRETAPGRAVFGLSVALSSLVLLVVWAVIDRLTGWDTSPVRDFYRVAAYAFTMVSVWRLLLTLLDVQRESKARRTLEATLGLGAITRPTRGEGMSDKNVRPELDEERKLPEPGPTVVVKDDPDVELSPNQDDKADLDGDD